MLNFAGLMSAKINFEVYLKRKHCLNANESARRRVVHVRASDVGEAKRIALAMPENSAFVAESVREVR